MSAAPNAATLPSPWQVVRDLAAKARAAETEHALLFGIANDTFALLRYRSALVFTVHHGELQLSCASGLTSVDRRSAFGSWAEQAMQALLPRVAGQNRFTADDLPVGLRAAWFDYWPEAVHVHSLAGSGAQPLGLVVYVSDTSWPAAAAPMLDILHQVHGLCLQNLRAVHSPWDGVKQLLDGRNLKTRKVLMRVLLVLLLLLLVPIRQFVIAPAEIVSLDAIAVTSPVEGIIAQMVAKPNQPVKKGDVLIRLDDTSIRNRLESARQSLEVSRAEYLAGAHRAFVSTDKTAEAGVLKGRINERLAEVAFLQDQLRLLDILASRDGIAVYGQENDWVGKPVSAGQRILELADSNQVGVHVWVPVADAINMRTGEPIHVLLYADPWNPLRATIELAGYQATKSPDGVAAYRVRATLPPQDKVRLGLRGNAKIDGEWVVLGYFIFRRPLSTVRQWLGV
jgi:multidrug resistance efflux pump